MKRAKFTKYLFLLTAFLASQFCYSTQRNDTIKFVFNPKIEGGCIKLDTKYFFQKTQTNITFSEIKFYISGIQFLKSGKIVFKEKMSFHLTDLRKNATLSFFILTKSKIEFDEVRFTFGIDSVTNELGIGEGDLDPIQGMYWAWQSGYINCKLEGTIEEANSKSEKFEFHLGGFLAPFQAWKNRSLQIENKKNINLDIHFDSLFHEVITSNEKELKVMSPGKRTVYLSSLIANSIQISKDEKP